jgi:glycosyltransferase involved in cell wall biosynthesis
MQISVTIITFNEASNIQRCLQSVASVADEIIVLDSYSTDQTVEIARQSGATVISQKFLGHIEQKNLAISNAQFDYILSLDADEALDKQLASEILAIKKTGKPAKAYWLNRYNNYCGQWIKFGAWRSDKKIRLFNKHFGTWGGINPHDRIVLSESVQPETLKGNLLHWSYNNIAEHQNKVNKYAEIAALAYQKTGKKSSAFKIVMSPVFRFVRDYFFKLGLLDGKNGLIIAALTAKEVYLKYKLLKGFGLNQN